MKNKLEVRPFGRKQWWSLVTSVYWYGFMGSGCMVKWWGEVW